MKKRGDGMKHRSLSPGGDLLMVSATLAWGFSYIFMKISLVSVPPLEMGFLRSVIAFPALLMLFRGKARPGPTELRYGALLGFFIFLLTFGYGRGLLVTDASTAGFLAGTTVAIVPILRALRDRRPPEKRIVLGVIFALGGVALLTLGGGFSFRPGALFCLGGAAAYAFHIIVSDSALKRCRELPLIVWQMAFAALYCGLFSFAAEETTFRLPLKGWLAILGLALISSAYGFFAQTRAQKRVAPERIGIIYSLEPVFCAVLAFFFFGEIMTAKELLGAALILLGILLC